MNAMQQEIQKKSERNQAAIDKAKPEDNAALIRQL